MGCIRLLVLTCVYGFWALTFMTGHAAIVATSPQTAAQLERRLPTPIDLAQVRLSAQSVAGFNGESLRILEDVPIGTTLAEVVSQREGAFSLFNPIKTYNLSPQKALWLHFRVLGQPGADQAKWSFELPKPFVDRVEFYYRGPQGSWQMQMAGDNIDQPQWPVRGLHPQFYLPNLAPGVNDFYVKVHQLLPLRFAVTLKTIELATSDNQSTLLADGLVSGLLVLTTLLAIFLAVAYKSAAYAWYAAYVFFALLAVVGYVGVGHFALWSFSPWWSEVSHGVCIKAALVAQLQFCRIMFVRRAAAPWPNRVTLVALGLSVLALFVPLVLPANLIELRMASTLFVLLTTLSLMLIVVERAAHQGSATAWLWVLAYVPIVCILAMTFAEQYAFVSLPWLPYNAIIFAVAFEVMVLMVALHLHAKSGYASKVRKMTLVELDPLTGFVAPLHYPDTLARLWGNARHRRQDMALAYVRADYAQPEYAQADDLRLDTNAAPDDAQQQLTSEELMLRCVRMLRTVTRPKDTVARIHPNVFAILMPGMALGPNFVGKLSRLRALGLMLDPDDAGALPVKFQIAATSYKSFSGTSSELDKALKDKLLELRQASGRSIEFVKN